MEDFEDVQYKSYDKTIAFSRKRKYISEAAWGNVREAKLKGKLVILKTSKRHQERTLLHNEDPEREKYNLGTIQKRSEDVFMKLYMTITTQSEILFLLEYARGGDIFDYISKNVGKISLAFKKHVIVQIAHLVTKLHEIGFAHCDISCENIVLHDDTLTPKVSFIDAACAQELVETKEQRFDVNVEGHRNVFDGRLHPCKRNYQHIQDAQSQPWSLRDADIFACKVVMWCIMFEHAPFDFEHAETDMSVYRKYASFQSGNFKSLAPNRLNVDMKTCEQFFTFLKCDNFQCQLDPFS